MQNTKKIFSISVFILIVLLISPSFLYLAENDDEVLVIGTGAIYKENLAEARKLAISDAYIKGIEAYLVKKLGSQAMINNFGNIINEIIPGSVNIIENYKTLAEEYNTKEYKILVSIKVNERLMKEKLNNSGVVLFEGVPLRVLFMISDRTSSDTAPFIWWDDPENKISLSTSEILINRFFQERGFNPVNRLTTMPENGYRHELFKAGLSTEEAVQWGKLYSADVVISGKVDVTEFNALVASIKAVLVENASVISSYSYEQIPGNVPDNSGTGMDTQESILRDCAEKLIPEILKSFKKEDEKLSKFNVVLNGLDSLKQVTEFMTFIKEKVSGIISVLPSKISKGTLTVSVEYAGAKRMFIEKVRRNIEVPFAMEMSVDEDGAVVVTAK